MKIRWTIGSTPILHYCAICGALIFYPLSKLLTGTNLCLHCGLKNRWAKWRRALRHRLGFHEWQLEGGFIPNDINELVSWRYVCRRCNAQRIEYTRNVLHPDYRPNEIVKVETS